MIAYLVAPTWWTLERHGIGMKILWMNGFGSKLKLIVYRRRTLQPRATISCSRPTDVWSRTACDSSHLDIYTELQHEEEKPLARDMSIFYDNHAEPFQNLEYTLITKRDLERVAISTFQK